MRDERFNMEWGICGNPNLNLELKKRIIHLNE